MRREGRWRRLRGRAVPGRERLGIGRPAGAAVGVRQLRGFLIQGGVLRLGHQLHEPLARAQQIRAAPHERAQALHGLVGQSVPREDLGLDHERLDVPVLARRRGGGRRRGLGRKHGRRPGRRRGGALEGHGRDARLGRVDRRSVLLDLDLDFRHGRGLLRGGAFHGGRREVSEARRRLRIQGSQPEDPAILLDRRVGVALVLGLLARGQEEGGGFGPLALGLANLPEAGQSEAVRRIGLQDRSQIRGCPRARFGALIAASTAGRMAAKDSSRLPWARRTRESWTRHASLAGSSASPSSAVRTASAGSPVSNCASASSARPSADAGTFFKIAMAAAVFFWPSSARTSLR